MSRSSLSTRRLYRMENRRRGSFKRTSPWRWKANEGLSKDEFVSFSLRYTSYSDISTLSKYQISNCIFKRIISEKSTSKLHDIILSCHKNNACMQFFSLLLACSLHNIILLFSNINYKIVKSLSSWNVWNSRNLSCRISKKGNNI